MINLSAQQKVQDKARELGLSSDIMNLAVDIISQNRNFVNAIDHGVEMDDYIYRAILRQSFEKRKQYAEDRIYAEDQNERIEALKDLTIMSREELTSDPFYRAVLPLIVKVLTHEPIQRLHVEEASAIILELADFKRKHRATSLTEIIVKSCSQEIETFQAA
jgi:hypothetical protein